MTAEKGLFKEGTPIRDTTPVGKTMFEEFGRRLGLPDSLIQKDLSRFSSEHAAVNDLIQGSIMSQEAKESYLSAYRYRRSTLQ